MTKQYSLLEDMEDYEIADKTRMCLFQINPDNRRLHELSKHDVVLIGRAFMEEKEEFNKRKEIEKVADYFETSGGESAQPPTKKQKKETHTKPDIIDKVVNYFDGRKSPDNNENGGWPGESPMK